MSRPDEVCRCGHPKSLHTWQYDDACSGPGPTHYGCSCPDFRPAAPAAGADLREQIAEAVQLALINPDATYQEIADELLAGPLRSLVEQAAEAEQRAAEAEAEVDRRGRLLALQREYTAAELDPALRGEADPPTIVDEPNSLGQDRRA